MELWHYGALACVGVLAGWLNVMAGGGSLLSLPALLFFGIEAPSANGSNRIAIIAQNVAAVASFRRAGLSDLRLSASLAAAATLGAVAGAQIGVRLDGAWFNRVLALVMIAVLIAMATGAEKKVDHAPGKARRIRLGHVLMVGAGAWGGFIQVGVGFLLMPILNRVMGFDLVRTNMHKVAVALTFNVAALLVFASHVPIAWLAGLALASGNAVGGWLGARSAVRGGERLIKLVLYAALGAMIVKLLFFP